MLARRVSRLIISRPSRWFSVASVQTSRLSSADLEKRRREVLYHSKQRGWLELDLILGTFSEKYLASLTAEEVDEYEKILEEENPDMFKWISGQTAVPEHLRSDLMNRLLRHVNENHPSVFQNQ